MSITSAAAQPTAGDQRSGVLIANQEVEPTVTIRWMSKDGERVLSGSLPYGPPTGGSVLSRIAEREQGDEVIDAQSNIRAYMALGGTRIDTGAGHPEGVVLRVGLTKVDSSRAFFAKIVPGTSVVIELEGVVLSKLVMYHEGTGMMHLKYAIGDLEACSLPGTARNQYLLSHPDDTLAGRVTDGINASRGVFDEREGELYGDLDVLIEKNDEGEQRVGFRFEVPYGLFRHLQDPWDSVLPGTFFEPIHLHAEVEMIPVWAIPIDLSTIIDTEAEVLNETNDAPDADPESDDD